MKEINLRNPFSTEVRGGTKYLRMPPTLFHVQMGSSMAQVRDASTRRSSLLHHPASWSLNFFKKEKERVQKQRRGAEGE